MSLGCVHPGRVRRTQFDSRTCKSFCTLRLGLTFTSKNDINVTVIDQKFRPLAPVARVTAFMREAESKLGEQARNARVHGS
jgi:hypothetical protein